MFFLTQLIIKIPKLLSNFSFSEIKREIPVIMKTVEILIDC